MIRFPAPPRVLVTDFDGTLVDDGAFDAAEGAPESARTARVAARAVPRPQTLAALHIARREGIRLVVASGRPLAFLRRVLPIAEGIVAENGAVVWDGEIEERVRWKEREAVLDVLVREHIVHEAFDVIVAGIPRDEEENVSHLLARAGVAAEIAENRDTIMLVPPGVEKSEATLALLARWNVPAAACVAVGDGENDARLLARMGIGAAVANAAREAREAANVRLHGRAGAGVVELIEAMVDARVAADAAGHRQASEKL
ncbi:MAG: HAD family hydrolase [Thermoplasmatota archaeon]